MTVSCLTHPLGGHSLLSSVLLRAKRPFMCSMLMLRINGLLLERRAKLISAAESSAVRPGSARTLRRLRTRNPHLCLLVSTQISPPPHPSNIARPSSPRTTISSLASALRRKAHSVPHVGPTLAVHSTPHRPPPLPQLAPPCSVPPPSLASAPLGHSL